MADIIGMICSGVMLIDIIANIILFVDIKRAQRLGESLVKRVEEWDRQDG